ncbi:MAG TPA: leucine-rich repeat protein [Candidatus Egerieousia sp.]|nr:leucine-rich repeat protein [Candidatus Egerieousia sp.]HPT06436.1 leucine-rich repeat protein [Candidatus Egerieousia sp.]
MVSLILPDEVENIGDYAFSGCKSITGVIVLGKKLKKVGYKAFSEVPAAKVYCKAADPPSAHNLGIANTNYLGVSTGSIKRYSAADYWSSFKVIEEVDFNALGY